MTLWLRDCSDFDQDPISLAGLDALTHKATEGTSIVHQKYGPRLNAWRGRVPVLGSYHVLRTPGSGSAGSLANQLQFWVSRMDSQTPWWRNYPFILQVDAEKWTYDQVQPSTVLQFAALLAGSGLPGWKVTYASRGQYGNSLTGIATPLWNADYGTGDGSYPGDTATVADKGRVAYWAPYSGQTPALLQFAGGPDMNAFRGSVDQLLALTTGGNLMALTDDQWADLYRRVQNIDNRTWQGLALGKDATPKDLLRYGYGSGETPAEDEPFPMWDRLKQVTVPTPAPVDPAVLKAALMDPAFLAAVAKAVNDDAAARLAQ